MGCISAGSGFDDSLHRLENKAMTAAEIRVFEKACEFAEQCINSGQTFDMMIAALKRAWTYVHGEKAYYARKDVQRIIQP